MPVASVVTIGERFGRLIIIGEAPSRRRPGGKIYRVVTVRCDCGTELEMTLSNLRSGNSTACGCTADAAFRARVTKHGMSEIVADMGATYFPHATLGRYGDTGDYSPTNCRWITKSENAKERNASRRKH